MRIGERTEFAGRAARFFSSLLPAFGGTADAGIAVAGGDETAFSADLRAAFFAGALAGLAAGLAAGFAADFAADFAAGFAGLVTAGAAVFALAALAPDLSVWPATDAGAAAAAAAASFAAVDATGRVARTSVVFLAGARRAAPNDSAIAFTSAGASGTADSVSFPVRLAVVAGCLRMATTLEGGGDFLLMTDPESE